MNKLTLQQLKDMKPNTIFDSGIAEIPHPWYGQSPEYPKTVEVKWVAIRGGIHDWAIYHSFHTNLDFYVTEHIKAPDQLIADQGQKLHDINLVKELVLCDEEALQMYRH